MSDRKPALIPTAPASLAKTPTGPDEGTAAGQSSTKPVSDAANGPAENEERFRALADAIPQLAWMAHADGFIHWYNRRWYEYTGTTPEQMEGWGWQSVHDPWVLPQVLERWKDSIGTGKPFDMVFPLRGADGRFRRFLTRVQPLKDAQGSVVQWFGTNTDVDELTRAEEALRASEKKLALALSSVGMGAWRLNLREQKRDFDEQVCRCLGIDPAGFLGTAEEFYAAVHPEDLKRLKAGLERTIATGAPYETEYRVVWPDGSLHYIATRGQLARDAAGQPQRIEGLVWDITAQKQAETEIRRRAEELRASNDELERFNRAMVGRELRMIELKQEVNALRAQLGQPARYAPRGENGGPEAPRTP
jgi:PAS domain S-box-containing protein